MTRTGSIGILWLTLGMLLPGVAPAQSPVKGSDHPLVGRFERSVLVGYAQKAFDSRSVVFKGTPDRSLQAGDSRALDGKVTQLAYAGPAVTAVEIYRNFLASLQSRGFASEYVCENQPGQAKACPDAKQIAYAMSSLPTSVIENGNCFKNSRYGLFKKGSEATVALLVSDCWNEKSPPLTLITVVEGVAMKTDQIVVPTAADMASAFAAEGRIALYGIFFDTGKAELKPESRPTLASIAALLGTEPSLALVVTGHTDNVGAFDANVALSKRRAEAVVNALVSEFKVSPGRLTAFGAGMTGPRGPNTDEAGRAKNRRVELSPR